MATSSKLTKAWNKHKGKLNTIIGVAAAVPGLFMGGAGLGVLSIGLDLSFEVMETQLKNYYEDKIKTQDEQNAIDRGMPSQPPLTQEALDGVVKWDGMIQPGSSSRSSTKR